MSKKTILRNYLRKAYFIFVGILVLWFLVAETNILFNLILLINLLIVIRQVICIGRYKDLINLCEELYNGLQYLCNEKYKALLNGDKENEEKYQYFIDSTFEVLNNFGLALINDNMCNKKDYERIKSILDKANSIITEHSA